MSSMHSTRFALALKSALPIKSSLVQAPEVSLPSIATTGSIGKTDPGVLAECGQRLRSSRDHTCLEVAKVNTIIKHALERRMLGQPLDVHHSAKPRGVMHALAILILTLSLVPKVSSQGVGGTRNGETATPIPGAGHDYSQLLNETVDPGSGSVNLRINFPTPPSRGVTFPVSYVYSSAGLYHFDVDVTGHIIWTTNRLSPGGWMYPTPTLTFTAWNYSDFNKTTQGGAYCQYFSNFAFLDSKGTTHNLNIGYAMALTLDGVTKADPSTCFGNQSGGTVYSPGGDAEVTAYFADSTVYGPSPSYTLSNASIIVKENASGTIYKFTPSVTPKAPVSFSSSAPLVVYPSFIEDSNGNIVRDNNGGIVDTAGRMESPGSSGGVTVTFKDVNTSASYTLPAKRVINNGATNCESITNGGFAVSGTQHELSSIVLPNETQYQFFYGNDNPGDSSVENPYGLLNEVIFPNGGWIKYTWKTSIAGTYSNLASLNSQPSTNASLYGIPSQCEYLYATPVLATRSVSYDGVTIAETQTFSYSTTWPAVDTNSFPNQGDWTAKSTSVTTIDNIRGTSFLKTYSYIPQQQRPGPFEAEAIAGQTPLERTVATYAGGSSTPVLEVETKGWFTEFLLGCEFATIDGVATSGHFYGYFDGQIADDKAYDYGQLTASSCDGVNPKAPSSPIPARETVTSYQVAGGDRVCKIVVLDSGTQIGEIDSYYDGGSSLCSTSPGSTTQVVSGLPDGTHDEASYGPTSAKARGNLTKQVRAIASGNTATTTYAYDETGQVISKTDPCGNASCSDMSGALHTVYYSYADAPSGGNSAGNSNAMLTDIKYPIGNMETKYSYNYETGEIVGVTDVVNNSTTTYAYSDPLKRLTGTTYPDGGQTTISYDDTIPSITTKVAMTSSVSKTSATIFDGMWHPIQTQVLDPSGTDYVDTTYDGQGRVHTQSVPHRGASGLVFSFSYDTLGRKTIQLNPDNTSKQWCYANYKSNGQTNCHANIPGATADWVDAADENSNDWQNTSDAFGRLTYVAEPNGSVSAPSMLTKYQYDALDNLVSVTQNGQSGSAVRARIFVYHDLSGLTSASNPETGTISYTYDLNGNVATKTDARGVTINYRYDVLNRLLSKSYSDSSTPWSCYQYDSSSVANGIGRLSASWTQVASAGNCATTAPASGFITKRTVTAYDAMGRLLSEQQYTPAGVATGITYAPSYTYDLAGNLWTSKDGVTALPTDASTLLTFTRTYDAAARLGTVTSNWVNSKHPGSIFAAQSATSAPCSTAAGATAAYAPFGGLQNAALGGGVLTLNRSYDSRLRLSCESDIGGINSPATAGSATVTITGAEQTK